MGQYGNLPPSSPSPCLSHTYASYDTYREIKCESYIFIKKNVMVLLPPCLFIIYLFIMPVWYTTRDSTPTTVILPTITGTLHDLNFFNQMIYTLQIKKCRNIAKLLTHPSICSLHFLKDYFSYFQVSSWKSLVALSDDVLFNNTSKWSWICFMGRVLSTYTR